MPAPQPQCNSTVCVILSYLILLSVLRPAVCCGVCGVWGRRLTATVQLMAQSTPLLPPRRLISHYRSGPPVPLTALLSPPRRRHHL